MHQTASFQALKAHSQVLNASIINLLSMLLKLFKILNIQLMYKS